MSYDLVCVGAGIANLALAYTTLKKDPNKRILILEKGPKITTRICPKTKVGYCVNCKPCKITTGFGGAGCFSDCKLTYSEEVGGTLIQYTGKEKFKELQDEAYIFFRNLGADAPIYVNDGYFKKLQESCEKNSLHLVESQVQHLGTEGSYELMCELYGRLKTMKCQINCNTTVTHGIIQACMSGIYTAENILNG